MLEKISLFPRVEAVWDERVRRRRWAQVVSVAGLILYFILLSSLISYFLILSKEENSTRSRINSYKERIESLKPVESKQVFLKSKLEELLGILEFEEKPEELLRDLETLTFSGINLEEINYQDENLRIEGGAQDVLILDEFVKNLEEKGKGLFLKAGFENVSKTKEGDYAFELLLLR